jgi:hypothetical protein
MVGFFVFASGRGGDIEEAYLIFVVGSSCRSQTIFIVQKGVENENEI